MHKTVAPFLMSERVFLGEGLLETLCVIDAKPCYADLHWRRIKHSAAALKIVFEFDLLAWQQAIEQCIAQNQLKHGGVKLMLVAGSAPRGLSEVSEKSRLLLEGFHYQSKKHGLKLMSAAWLRDANNPIYQHKSINYLEAIVACRQAQQLGADDVVFFNLQQQITETSIANIFMIKNQQLLTPDLQQGVLPGVIRQRLLSLCRQHGIVCRECSIDKQQLMQADAIFVCNALQGIRAVAAWDNSIFDTTHPLVSQLQTLLAEDQLVSLAGPTQEHFFD